MCKTANNKNCGFAQLSVMTNCEASRCLRSERFECCVIHKFPILSLLFGLSYLYILGKVPPRTGHKGLEV
jgi:hypothetical protein